MKFTDLKSINSFYFSVQDAAHALGITDASARLSCHRYTKHDLLVRPMRNVYVLAERWKYTQKQEFFTLANRLQVPSYLSFASALEFYEITTQIRRNSFESAARTRTKNIEVKDARFQYFKIQKKLYFSFIKKNGFFIATPEKAFLDAVYLMSLGRYNLDLSSIDIKKLDPRALRSLARRFPQSAQDLLAKRCKI